MYNNYKLDAFFKGMRIDSHTHQRVATRAIKDSREIQEYLRIIIRQKMDELDEKEKVQIRQS